MSSDSCHSSPSEPDSLRRTTLSTPARSRR